MNNNSDLLLIKNSLHEIASHAYNLAMGLQNAAPPQAPPGPSVKYLQEIALRLEKISKDVEALLETPQK